jgi:hypothetical protein
MHTLKLNEAEGLWEVGHYDIGTGQWVVFESFTQGKLSEAMHLVNYLNGGPASY